MNMILRPQLKMRCPPFCFVFGNGLSFFCSSKDVTKEVTKEGEGKEIVACFARKDEETAVDLLLPLIEGLVAKDGRRRTFVELRTLIEKKDRETWGIHDARVFELIKNE